MFKVFNFVLIYGDHIRNTKKSLLIWILGIVLILTIFASSILVVNFISPKIYPTMIKKWESPTYDYNDNSLKFFPDFRSYPFDIDMKISAEVTSSNIESFINLVNTTISSPLKETHFANIINSVPFYYYLDGFSLNINTKSINDNFSTVDKVPIIIYEMTPILKNELTSLLHTVGFGTLPLNSSEGLLFHLSDSQTKYVPSMTTMTNLTISLQSESTSMKPQNLEVNSSILLSGAIEPGLLSYNIYPALVNTIMNSYFGLNLQKDPRTLTLFVPNLKNFLVSVVSPAVLAGYQYYDSLTVHAGFNLNFKKLDPFAALSDLSYLKTTTTQLSNNLTTIASDTSANVFGSSVNFQSENIFKRSASELLGYLLIMFTLSLPVFIIVSILSNYCFGITEKLLVEKIKIYKQRGLKNSSIIWLQAINLLLSTVIASLLSLFTGYLLASFVSSSTSLSHFDFSLFSPIVVNITTIFLALFIIGLLYSFLTQFSKIMKFIQRENYDSLDGVFEEWKPLWKRLKLDIWFLVIGTIGSLFCYFTFISDSIFIPISQILFYPMAFLVLIGLFLFFYRITPILLVKLDQLVWKKMKVFLSLALKDLLSYKKSTTRAIMVIGIITTTFIVLTTVTTSNTAYNYNTLLYNDGAQGVIIQPSYNSTYFYNSTLESSIIHNYSVYISQITPFLQLQFYANDSFVSNFLAINTSSFSSTASFPKNPGLYNSLQQDLDHLSSNNSNLNIIVDKNFLETNHLQIGNNFSLNSNVNSQSFHVIDYFSNWPRLYPNGVNVGHNSFGIIDIKPFITSKYNFTKSIFVLSQSGFYLKFNSGINQNEMVNLLEKNLSVPLTTVQIEQSQTLSDPTTTFIISQINANIVFLLVCVIIIAILFVVRQIFNKKSDIFVEIELGSNVSHLFFQFMAESEIIVLFGLLIGIIIGFLSSELIGVFFQFQGLLFSFQSTIIEYRTVFPMSLVGIFIILSILFSLAGAMFTSWVLTRREISGIFQIE